MKRDGQWESCAISLPLLSLNIGFEYREVTQGERVSVTLTRPSHLGELWKGDWDKQRDFEFPVHP